MSVFRSVSKSVFPSVHRATNVPAALLGGGASFNPASISGLRSRLLDAATFTSPIDSKYYLKDSSTTNTHLPRQGRCWLFDGLNDEAVTASNIGLTGDVTATLMTWVKPVALTDFKPVVSFGSFSVASQGFCLGFMADGSVGLFTAGARSAISGPQITNGTWFHIAVTKTPGSLDSTNVKVYINGVSVALVTTNVNAPNVVASPLRIGFSPTLGYTSASIRDARVYNVAKTAGEVSAIYNQSRTGNGTFDSTGLLAAYPCNEESGTTGYDISGNGRHLTLTNITQATFHAADTGVTANPNNAEGYRLSGSVYIPKRLTDSLAADGNALTVTGRAAYHGCAETPCFTGNGSTVYADLGANISIPGEHTTCAWIKTPTVSVGTMIIMSNSGPASQIDYQLDINRSAGKVSALANGATVAITSTGSIAVDTWTHIAVVKSGSTGNWTFKIYINGVLDSTATTSQNASGTTDSRFAIARLGAANFFYFSGSVADARLFSVAKSDSEIMAICQGASDTAGLQGRWPMQDGPGSSNTNRTIYDVSGNGRTLTLVNGTVSTIWGNRVPGNVEDWCVKYGGRIAANGAFVAGMLTGGNAADGSAKTLAAGKFGNPFSRLNLNPATAAELNGRSVPTAAAAGADINATITPAESAFRRTKTDGDDRLLIYDDTLSGADLSNVEGYVA